MTYYPKRVGRRRLGHGSWRRGFFWNSRAGSEYFGRRRKTWTDKDGHVSAPDENGQCAWINGHGAPETAWLPKGDRFENHTAAELLNMHITRGAQTYALGDLRGALEDNHREGMGTEWDVKNIEPWDTEEILDDLMARAARHALQVYGPRWREHFNIKILTTWGLPYAFKIARAAHKHTIPVLLSARGKYRFKSYAGHEEITYVRKWAWRK